MVLLKEGAALGMDSKAQHFSNAEVIAIGYVVAYNLLH